MKIKSIKKFFKLCCPLVIGGASILFLTAPFVFFAKDIYHIKKQGNNINLQNDTNKISSKNTSLYTYIPNEVVLNGMDEFFVNNASIPNKENNKNYFTYDKIYPAQHFGDEWLQVEYVNGEYHYTLGGNNDLTKIHQGIKSLVISATQNLPDADFLGNPYDYLTDDTYMKISNFYVDNYNGEIIVDIEFGVYYDNSGILIDTITEPAKKKLTSSTRFSGFKIADKTQFSNNIVIYEINGEEITNENITSFVNATDALTNEFVNTISNRIELNSDIWGETQTQFNTTAVHIDDANELGNQVTIYPGLKQLRTKIGVNNFFDDLYLDTNTFKIYADNPQNNRIKIGTFIPEEPIKSNTLRKFVANYDNSNSLTTYVKEGTYNAVPSIRNTHPSDVTIRLLKENMFRNIDDFLANPIKKNIDGKLTNLSALEIITTDEDLKNPELGLVNNITGEVTIKAKVGFNVVGSTPGEYKYQGNIITSDMPEAEQLGRERIYTIVIDNFLPIKATSIASYINASTYNFLYKPSEMRYGISSKNLLIQLLRSATDDGSGFLSIPENIDIFFENCVDFEIYQRPQGGTYYGVPNDKDGTLYLTIELKKYYNQINGLLVDVTADETLPTMKLTVTIQQMQTVNLSNVPVLKSNVTEPTYIDWYEDSIPTELLGNIQTDIVNGTYSGEFTKQRIQDAVYEYAIVGAKDVSLKNNIDFITVNQVDINDPDAYKNSDQYKSINDDLTSNIDGTLNLYFHISGVYDESDAIEITVESQESYLFRGFKSIQPTHLVSNIFLTNQKIYATDITDSVDPKEELAKSILTLDGTGKPFNLENLFENTKGIPDVVANELINKNFQNVQLALTAFNEFFEIVEIHNINDSYYYQNCEITASVALKVYYDENGRLIDTRTDESANPLTKRITFSGYENANPSSIISIVGLSDVVNDYASDYDDINKLEDLILRNFSEIGENFPKKFLDNTIETNGLYTNSYMTLQNPIINNSTGRISVDVNINSAYFDEENTYVQSDEEKTQIFSLVIEGFAPASATVIKPIIKLNDLNTIDNEPYQTDLIYWSQINGDGNPTDILNTNYLKRVISNNINTIVNNPYQSEKALIDDNYFSIENPVINYANGSIEFELILNYYFSGSNAYPISPQNPNNSVSGNNRATINIIGFDRCYETTKNNFNVSNTSLKDYTASYVKNLWDTQQDKASQMILNSIISSERNLKAVFNNLPSVYFEKNDDGVLEFASRKIQIQDINYANDSNDHLNISMNVDAAFVNQPVNDLLTIRAKEFIVTFDGFKSGNINTSINNDIWDIDRAIVSNTNISYWNTPEIAKNKLQLLLSNNSSIYEGFIDNLVYDSTGRLISQVYVISDDNNIIDVIAKKGTVTFSAYVTPYYDENGVEQNDERCTFRVQIRNFKTQNPTTINQNTIYTDELTNTAVLSNEDPLFGTETVSNFLHKEDAKGNSLLKDALINNGGRRIIETMLSNTQADYGGDKNNTIIDSVNITSKQFNNGKYAGNDFDGSLTFKISIKNYFDSNGVWNTENAYTVNEIFTIYQNNKTQKTNLSNTDASVEELANIYKQQGVGDLNFNPNMKASDFYNQITDEKNFGFFENFMESLVDTGLYGISAKNTPSGWNGTSIKFEPLEMEVYNDDELASTNSNYKNYIDFNNEQGWVSIKVKYNNVYEEETQIFANVDKNDSQTINTLESTPSSKEITLKIVGFNKDTQTNDFIIIIAAVASSIGFILILGLLIAFIIKKAREHH